MTCDDVFVLTVFDCCREVVTDEQKKEDWANAPMEEKKEDENENDFEEEEEKEYEAEQGRGDSLDQISTQDDRRPHNTTTLPSKVVTPEEKSRQIRL